MYTVRLYINVFSSKGLGSLNGEAWEELRRPLKDAMLTSEAVDVLMLPWINEVEIF